MAVDSAFTLTPNDIYATLGNMIISQQVFADNFGKHQTLVDKARVDGTLFGDRKLYYSVDALKTVPWLKDSEATNLLALDRPKDPKVQAIVLDQYRQIRLTVDNYLTKKAWADEGAFSSFNGIMLGLMRETKRIYDGTNYNVYIGTKEASSAKVHSRAITLSGTNDGQTIAQALADLLVEMGDYSRDFNDYGHMRSYSSEDIKVVWNSKFVNKIRKVDTPTIFHREGLVDKLDEDVIPAKYFGVEITTDNYSTYSASTPAAGKPIKSSDGTYVPGSNNANGTLRSAVEQDVTVSGTTTHLFAGEELPSGAVVYADSAVKIPCYIEDAHIIAKVLVKLPPYMSAFEVATSFFNSRSLTENHYLTFGHNTLAYFKNYPFLTLKKA